MALIGHQKIRNFLDKSIERGTLAQAYLFTGPKHLGKFSVALHLAGKMTGGMDLKINPDIIIVAPEIEDKKGIIKKKDIKVEQVRELQRELALAPQNGKCRVAIIDDAERLTTAAQNALLKTLEEPNEKSSLILVCHNLEKILPTIRSRVVIKNFGLVAPLEIERVLPEASSAEAVFWSLGRPGLAVEFSKYPQKLEVLEESKKELAEIFENHLADKFSLAEELGKDTSKLKEKLEIWTVLLRQNILTEDFPLTVSREKALELIEQIAESLRLIQETNSSPRIVLENLFLRF